MVGTQNRVESLEPGGKAARELLLFLSARNLDYLIDKVNIELFRLFHFRVGDRCGLEASFVLFLLALTAQRTLLQRGGF